MVAGRFLFLLKLSYSAGERRLLTIYVLQRLLDFVVKGLFSRKFIAFIIILIHFQPLTFTDILPPIDPVSIKKTYYYKGQNQSKCWYTSQGPSRAFKRQTLSNLTCSKYIYRSKWVNRFWLVKALSGIVQGGQNDSKNLYSAFQLKCLNSRRVKTLLTPSLRRPFKPAIFFDRRPDSV